MIFWLRHDQRKEGKMRAVVMGLIRKPVVTKKQAVQTPPATGEIQNLRKPQTKQINTENVQGLHPRVWGDFQFIRGDVSGISGDVTGKSGGATDIIGDISYLPDGDMNESIKRRGC